MEIKTPALDEQKLNQFLGQVIMDQGATMHAPLIVLGDRLGLYKALAQAGMPLTSSELAERTETSERYIREWLRAQAAGGYVTYYPEADRYGLSAEQAFTLADEDSPAFIIGGFQVAMAASRIMDRLAVAFKTFEGVGWHEHDHDLFEGTERTYRAGYIAHLTTEWIPALKGVEQKLKRGARVADVGSGHGASTILMAQAYPNSTFTGYDYHQESIQAARKRAEKAGVANRVRFEQETAKTFNGAGYDLITMFDCLHDLGDPEGAVSHIRSMLRPDGTLMIVEPNASDSVAENIKNPVSRLFYSASTLFCVPNSIYQEHGVALGAQAGETAIRKIVEKAGFVTFRCAAETPFNKVYEARLS